MIKLKKVISILLAAAVIFTASGGTAFATSVSLADLLSEHDLSELRSTVNAAAAKLAGVKDKVSVSNALFDDIVSRAGKNASVADINRVLAGYVVLDTRELPETAKKIADGAEYKILNGNVVYVVVNIEDNPELYDIITLCHTSAALIEKQNEFVAESERTDLIVNDYSHLAGELALHCAVFALAKAAGGANADSPFNSRYESAKDAELNQNETRGAELIKILGSILTTFYKMIGGVFGA